MAQRPTAPAAPALWGGLSPGCKVLVDTAPFIYMLEDHPVFAPHFVGLFEAAAAASVQIALSAITLAEVLTGPYRAGQAALAQRFEKTLLTYEMVPVSAEIAVQAARMRAHYRLKLPDAIQLATALDIGAEALVTHDRDFARVKGLTILRGPEPA